MPKKGTGLSREPRIRAKQNATLEAFAEQIGTIGADPALERKAMIQAVEVGGYTRAQTDEAKLKQFMRLWKSDESRAYLAELWGLAVVEHPDPVSIAFQTIHQHMVQDDDSWGERERGVSLSAAKEIIKLFVPAQTTKVLMGHVSGKIERPAEYDVDPIMEARTILPAGTTISKPTGPVGSADDDEESDDEEDDDE